MKTYIIIFEGFVQFEVTLASYLLHTKGDIITVGIDKEPVVSYEGFRVIPDIKLDEMNTNEVDCLIIPGGIIDENFNDSEFYKKIDELNSQKKVIGGICSGVYHIAKAGVLKGKGYTTTLHVNEYPEFDISLFRDQLCVVDENIVTAKANGYVDFGIELGKVMNIYEDENDLQETIEFFREFKG